MSDGLLNTAGDILKVGGAIVSVIPGGQVIGGIAIGAGVGLQIVAAQGDNGAAAAGGTSQRQASQQVNVASTENALPLVYGQAKLGITYVDVAANGDDLYIVGALAHGPRAQTTMTIGSIDEIYFNNIEAVNSSGTLQDPYTSDNLVITKYLGAGDQSSDATLVATFSDWTTAHDGRGVVYLIAKLIRDEETYQGIPNITCLVTGNPVEDHRAEVAGATLTFATAGDTITRSAGDWTADGDYAVDDWINVSGSASNDGYYQLTAVTTTVLTVSQNLTNEGPTTAATIKRWAHSDNGGDNPALCLRDYLLSDIYGAGASEDEIDETSFEEAADYCDETVSVPDGGGGSVNQTRFAIGGFCNTANSVQRNIQILLNSMRGWLIYEGGKFRLFIPQSDSASSITLTEDNIIGDWSFATPGIDTKFNIVRAHFTDPDTDYQPNIAEWPYPGDTNTWLTDDNSFEVVHDIALPLVNDVYRAQQIAMTTRAESRETIVVGVTATDDLLRANVGTIVPITHATPGWTAKNFQILAMSLLPSGHIRLALREYETTVYTIDTQDDADASPNTNLPNPFNPVDREVLTDMGLTRNPADTLGLWAFNEGRGTVVRDYKSAAPADIDTAGAGWIKGPFGYAYDINAAAQINADHATAHDIGTGQDFTIDMVFQYNGNSGGTQQLVLHDNDYNLAITLAAGAGILTYNHANGTTSGSFDFDFEKYSLVDRWIHLKYQYDNTADASTAWVNGRQLPVEDDSSGSPPGGTIGDTLEIGHNSNATKLNGSIAYLRVALELQDDFPGLPQVLAANPELAIVTDADETLPAGNVDAYVDATGANRTITMLTEAECIGARYTIQKTDSSSNTVTIENDAAGTIATLSTQDDWVILHCDGTTWRVFA